MDKSGKSNYFPLWLRTIPIGFLGNLLVFSLALLIDSGTTEVVVSHFHAFEVWVFYFIVTAIGLLAGEIVRISIDFRKRKWWYYGLGYGLVTVLILTFSIFRFGLLAWKLNE